MQRYRKSVRNYVKHGGRPVCVFCERESNEVLEETQSCYVMRSNFAYDLWEFRDVLEHLLIAPKRHVESLLELTPEERADIMEIAARYEADHYDIYARGVASITRTVPKHQHTHLIKSADKPSKLAVYVTKPHFLFKV